MSHANPLSTWLLRLSLVIMGAVVVPVIFFVGSPASAQQAVPDQPEGLTGKLLYYLAIGLDWDDVEGATSYQARYWDTTGDSPAWAEAPEAEYDGSSAVVSGLSDQRFYYFQVRAVNDAGASEWSDFFLTDNAWPEAPGNAVAPVESYPLPEFNGRPAGGVTPANADASQLWLATDGMNGCSGRGSGARFFVRLFDVETRQLVSGEGFSFGRGFRCRDGMRPTITTPRHMTAGWEPAIYYEQDSKLLWVTFREVVTRQRRLIKETFPLIPFQRTDSGWRMLENQTINLTHHYGIPSGWNRAPTGLYSDGTTIWVSGPLYTAYAYDIATKARDSSKDLALPEESRTAYTPGGYKRPGGLWSDGETVYILGRHLEHVFAFDKATLSRAPERDFRMRRFTSITGSWSSSMANSQLWSDGEHLWVREYGQARFAAYPLPKATVVVTVTNGAPSFGQALYAADLPGDSGDVASLVTVSATDPEHDPLRYAAGGSWDARFAIDPQSGVISYTRGDGPPIAAGEYRLSVTAADGLGGTAETAVVVTVAPPLGICGRTPQVRDAILARMHGISDCAAVTGTHLGAVSILGLRSKEITVLQPGDFADLSSLQVLHLENNGLSSLPPGIFDELGSLGELHLNNNQLSSLPSGVFDELGSLGELHLNNNQLSSLPSGVFDELGGLRRLDLSQNQLSPLPPGIFDELGSLYWLHLNNIGLSSLPPGIFDELGSLGELHLNNNQLSSLPPGIFDELGSLGRLDLIQNQLSSLPPGIFDELGRLYWLHLNNNQLSSLPPGIFDELGRLHWLNLSYNQLSSLPPRLLPRVEWRTNYSSTVYMVGNRLTELPDALFEVEDLNLGILHLQDNPGSDFTFAMEAEPLSQSIDDEGIHTARVRYKVAQGAPAAMSATLEVSGGVASTASITIAAGSVYSDEIVVKQSAAGQPVTLTLQKVSPHIPHPFTADSMLHRSPKFDYIGFFGVRFAAGAALTLFADSVAPEPLGICGRTPQVRDAILARLPGISDCAAVTDADLGGISGDLGLSGIAGTQDLGREKVRALKSGDFGGLSSLQRLWLPDNSLEALPEDVFEGLTALTSLHLQNNKLGELPEGVFEPLGSLRTLRLENNELGGLPEGVFEGLASLEGLFLTLNKLGALPGGVFEGLAAMDVLYLDGNELSELPAGVFDGLSGLRELRLNGNSLSGLAAGVFEGLSGLRGLELESNDLETLPAGVFEGLSGLERLFLDGNEGAPFTLTAELERRGGGAVAVRVVEGAPFAMEVKLSADGGTLSPDTVTVEAGRVSSEAVSVAAAGEGRREVTVSVESAEFVGVVVAVDKIGNHGGIRTGLGEELVLDFEGSPQGPDGGGAESAPEPEAESAPEPEASPAVGVSLSSGSVGPGTEIGVTMSFSGLEPDSDTATTDYVFRADVKDPQNRNADGCEDRANGYGLGVDRYMYKVDQDPETRTGTISAGCPAGDYTLRASVSSPDGVELAAAGAVFSIAEPPQPPQPEPASNDATLSGLELTGVGIGAFDPATTDYAAEADHDVDQTTVTATTNDDGATYVIKLDGATDEDGEIPLAVGSNAVTVEVTAADGDTTNTYKVTVTRAAPPSTDAALSGLALSDAPFAFASDTTSYDVSVAHDVDQTTVTATANDGGANYLVKLDGAEDEDGTVSLAVGSNVIAVEVTAEDGDTTRTYTVTVARAAPPSTDAALSGLALSDAPFAFASDITSYDVNVAHDVDRTTVTATANDDGATYAIKLDGVTDEDGEIPLAEGNNVITIEVTAEDGQTTKTYTVTVARAAPPAPQPTAPPAAPDAPAGRLDGAGNASLDWNDVATATSYQVNLWWNNEWTALPNAKAAGVGVAFDGSRATVSGLPTRWTLYWFQVRAVNSAGHSHWSRHSKVVIP